MDPRLIFEVVMAAASLGSSFVSLKMALAVSDLRREIAVSALTELKAKIAEREELRNWINGSFMRSAVVEKTFTEFERRLQNVEDIAS